MGKAARAKWKRRAQKLEGVEYDVKDQNGRIVDAGIAKMPESYSETYSGKAKKLAEARKRLANPAAKPELPPPPAKLTGKKRAQAERFNNAPPHPLGKPLREFTGAERRIMKRYGSGVVPILWALVGNSEMKQEAIVQRFEAPPTTVEAAP